MKNSKLAESMKTVLANTYALYLKTQNYHWNVEGPHFKPLHELFEEQYTDLAGAIDEMAELIRGLGHKAPGTFSAYSKLITIKDGDETATAETMVKELAEDQEKMEKLLNETLKIAQDEEDEVITDALIGRLTVHRKNKWILSSSL